MTNLEIIKKAELKLTESANVGDLYINDKIIDIVEFGEDEDYWYGFGYDEKSFDLNIYIDDLTGEMKASIYEVHDGKTDTSKSISVKIIESTHVVGLAQVLDLD
jgi:hypothetical protein